MFFLGGLTFLLMESLWNLSTFERRGWVFPRAASGHFEFETRSPIKSLLPIPHVHILIHTHTGTNIHTHTHTYTQTQAQTLTHTYTHKHTRTHIDTNIHTHTLFADHGLSQGQPKFKGREK